MTWRAASVVQNRVEFVLEYLKAVMTKEMSFSALCRKHEVSRQCGYETVALFDEFGWTGLIGRSRAPHSGMHWAETETIQAVLQTRSEFPEWGAKKIVAYLRDLEPDRRWPVPSVAHEWLRKAGLVVPRMRARRFSHPGRPAPVPIIRPNQQWSIDFKGHFRTRDRRYCYPLTVVDSFSRYVLGCEALGQTSFEMTWPVLERIFREYGLPETLLSDNGSPFSSNSVRRLSKLSVRLIRLGIAPILTEPGKPQQNGRHERMHRTLKDAACARPGADRHAQQVQFDEFLHQFNTLRPHEAMGLTPPARHYERSLRPYPKRLPEITYPDGVATRRVRSSGEIKWNGQWLFLSEPLVGQTVGFEQIADGCWIVKFAHLELGYYSQRDKKLHLDRTKPDGKAEND